MATFSFQEQRAIIRFHHYSGVTPIEIHRQLSETCGDVMDVSNVFSWVIRQHSWIVVAFSGLHTGLSTDPVEKQTLDEMCSTVSLQSSKTTFSTDLIMSSDRLERGRDCLGLLSHDSCLL